MVEKYDIWWLPHWLPNNTAFTYFDFSVSKSNLQTNKQIIYGGCNFSNWINLFEQEERNSSWLCQISADLQNIMKLSLQSFDSVKIPVWVTVSLFLPCNNWRAKRSQRWRWMSSFPSITPHRLPLVIYRGRLYRVVRQPVASRCLSYTGEPTFSTEAPMSNFSFSPMSSEYIALSERRRADEQIGSLLPSLWMRQSSLMDGAYHRSSHEEGWQ